MLKCVIIIIYRYFSDVSEHLRTGNDEQQPPSISPIPSQSLNNNNNNINNSSPTEVDSSPNNNNNNNRRIISSTNKPYRCESIRSSFSANNQNRRHNSLNDPFSRVNTTSIDIRLNEWLIKNNVDITSRTIIFNEEFTYEDFVYDLDKSDLHRIGLK